MPGEHSLAPPGYPLTPLLFLIPIVTVIVLQIARDPVRSSIGLAVVLLGIPFAGWALSGRRPAAQTATFSNPIDARSATSDHRHPYVIVKRGNQNGLDSNDPPRRCG